MTDTRTYVVPITLKLRTTPYGALQVDTELADPVGEIPVELVDLFTLFLRPQTIDSAHAAAVDDLPIERDDFGRLVETWLALGLLRASDDLRGPSRLRVFKQACDEYFAGSRSRPFPLRSPLPTQRPLMYYPGLDSREVYDRADFAWTKDLEAAFPAIRRELEAMLRDAELVEVNKAYTSAGEWAAGHLWIFGQRNDKVCAACPETARVVANIQGSLGIAMFSALAPGTFLAPHCGYTTAKLRCQLPLIVPPDCRLKVGDEEIVPEEGKCIVFDDSFLHTAWNDSDRVRYVLLFDFFHPDLSSEEVAYLTQLAETKQLGKGYQQEAKSARAVDWTRPT